MSPTTIPIIEGAPGHGEGHNSGVPLNITAAIAVKKIMEREKLPGTLILWPGVAEEQLATKAYLRARRLLQGCRYLSVHACRKQSRRQLWSEQTAADSSPSNTPSMAKPLMPRGAPWRGRSALDAVELMDIGWNFRREHLRTQQRSHYVITDGGDQPNVVPSRHPSGTSSAKSITRACRNVRGRQHHGARRRDDDRHQDVEPHSRPAWPGHFNKTIAEVTYENIKSVGLPEWSEADQTLAGPFSAK